VPASSAATGLGLWNGASLTADSAPALSSWVFVVLAAPSRPQIKPTKALLTHLKIPNTKT